VGACMCVCKTLMYTPECKCIKAFTRIHVCMHTCSCACAPNRHARAHAHARSRSPAHAHTRMHTCTHARSRSRTHVCARPHRCTTWPSAGVRAPPQTSSSATACATLAGWCWRTRTWRATTCRSSAALSRYVDAGGHAPGRRLHAAALQSDPSAWVLENTHLAGDYMPQLCSLVQVRGCWRTRTWQATTCRSSAALSRYVGAGGHAPGRRLHAATLQPRPGAWVLEDMHLAGDYMPQLRSLIQVRGCWRTHTWQATTCRNSAASSRCVGAGGHAPGRRLHAATLQPRPGAWVLEDTHLAGDYMPQLCSLIQVRGWARPQGQPRCCAAGL